MKGSVGTEQTSADADKPRSQRSEELVGFLIGQ